MQTYSLNISDREKTGRSVARRLRAGGRIPAALYGQGRSRSISVSSADFCALNRKTSGAAAVIELKDESGEIALALVQAIQRDAVKNTVDHIDFQEVQLGHVFTTRIPVILVGEADCVGVKLGGGVINHKLHEVEIRCRPSKLPEHVEADVTGVEVGGALHISDLPALDEVEYLGESAQVVVSVQPPTVAIEPTTEGEGTAADEVPATKVSADAAEPSKS